MVRTKLSVKLSLAAVLLAGLPACSSMIDGTSQTIAVDTSPPGADCALKRENATVARINPTPGTATVKKAKQAIVIACNLDGYQEATYINSPQFDAVSILGGGIGLAIDSASGANRKYISPVTLQLMRLSEPEPSVPASSDGAEQDDEGTKKAQ